MQAEFMTRHGIETGLVKTFCNFYGEGFFVTIGLDAFASTQPNIAATYLLVAEGIDPTQESLFPNPSHRVCARLGGATIGFVADGGFANQLGQADVCVFGDGSMVSAWTLIYMSNHREGYDEIRHKIRSLPLDIPLPLS